jgi:hypothetical protein
VVRGSALCALNGTNPKLGRDAIVKLMEVRGGLAAGGLAAWRLGGLAAGPAGG